MNSPKRQKTELLSPAKNTECGIEAINHGADAVYIGAPKFSARAAASNTIEEIESLVKYAHRYYAKIYVALNTILDDRELAEAGKIIKNLYEVGVDAIIIQDMGILQLDIPPISLHASTQTDNRTVEKVQFLEQAGFDQVVLARELSLEQIRQIAAQTSVRLEMFVHGALCVSYSGQCYISEVLRGRSANKGVCAQMCRLPYSLSDAAGNVIAADKHLLSLKDLNLSGSLRELIDAGVSSFKIEGRLKEVSYVKNVTAYYRQKLDEVLEGTQASSFAKATADKKAYATLGEGNEKSSSGKCKFFFTPNPEKSFNRGFTDYFLRGRHNDLTSFDSPKFVGEYIGVACRDAKSCVSTRVSVCTKKIANGDGCCYFNRDGELQGFKVNKVEGNKIFPAEPITIAKGTELYRNYDHTFEKSLSKKSAERKVRAHIDFAETDEGFCITITDEDDVTATIRKKHPKELARDGEKTKEAIHKQFSRTGNTIFEISDVFITTDHSYFIPPSVLAEWGRELVALSEAERERRRPRTIREIRGAKYSFERENRDSAILMFCKHCLKYSFGLCPKKRTDNRNNYKEPFFLSYNNNKEKLQLDFDCGQCEMRVKPYV